MYYSEKFCHFRSGLNFINVKRARFSYERHFGSFFLCMYVRKKAAKTTFVRKMRASNVDEIDTRFRELKTITIEIRLNFQTNFYWSESRTFANAFYFKNNFSLPFSKTWEKIILIIYPRFFNVLVKICMNLKERRKKPFLLSRPKKYAKQFFFV